MNEEKPQSATGMQNLPPPDALKNHLDQAASVVREGLEAGWDKLSGCLDQEASLLKVPAQLSSRTRTGLGLSLSLLLLGLVAALTLRADFSVYPPVRMLVVLSGLSALFLMEFTLLVRPIHKPCLKSSWWAAAALGAAALPVLFALLPAAHVSHPASLAGQGPDLWPHAFACLVFGTVVGLPLLILLALLERRQRPGILRWALAALASGLLGNLALQLHCPITHPQHLLWGHATVGLALVLVTAGLYPLLLKLRS